MKIASQQERYKKLASKFNGKDCFSPEPPQSRFKFHEDAIVNETPYRMIHSATKKKLKNVSETTLPSIKSPRSIVDNYTVQ